MPVAVSKLLRIPCSNRLPGRWSVAWRLDVVTATFVRTTIIFALLITNPNPDYISESLSFHILRRKWLWKKRTSCSFNGRQTSIIIVAWHTLTLLWSWSLKGSDPLIILVIFFQIIKLMEYNLNSIKIFTSTIQYFVNRRQILSSCPQNMWPYRLSAHDSRKRSITRLVLIQIYQTFIKRSLWHHLGATL